MGKIYLVSKLLFGSICAISVAAVADNNSLKIEGLGVTGWNQLYGEPIADLRFVGMTHLHVGGVFNPDGNALPIDASTSPDALLASYAAPAVYLNFFGVSDAASVPNQNIIYAEYPQLGTHDSQTFPLPQLSENTKWFGKNNGAATRGLTVSKWLQVRGSMELQCDEGERPYYELDIENAIPGGLYTVWGFYFDAQLGRLMPDYAFGGTSANAFTGDKDGSIKASRSLNVCLQAINPVERYQPVTMFLVFHPDGRVNAAVGHTVATAPFNGPGMTATPQMMFPMPNNR